MARAFLGPVKYLVSGAVCVGILAYAAPVLVPLLPLSGMNGELLNSMVNGHPLDRMEDGSARYPLLFRDFLRNNQTITKGLAQENQDWPAVINGDNIDAFQDMMRKSKEEAEMRQNAVEDAKAEKDGKISRKLEKCLDKGKKSPQQCEADAENARMGNNPAIRRMKMMGPVPTEDDMYNQQAPEVPAHMRCDACQAVAYQGAKGVAEALAARKRDDKVSILTIEALETTCHNVSLWMYGYGYAPGPTGVNLFVGPGVEGRGEDAKLHWDEDNGDTVVPQTQHSDGIGRRLSSACLSVLLGESPDEEEIAGAILGVGVDPSSTDKAAAALRAIACEKAGQPCAGK